MAHYNDLARIVELYQELDKGCKVHKSYRARRKPRANSCDRCNELWEIRKWLEKLTGQE